MPYETYSLGMKARLCLSIATAMPCELLLLDEVFESADAPFQQRMSIRMNHLIQGAQAMILVSHSAQYVRDFCNRAIVLHESKIAYDGNIEQALTAYRFLSAPLASLAGADDDVSTTRTGDPS